MPIVALGDGICSLTGEKRGNGQEVFKNIGESSSQKQTQPSLNYQLFLIDSYQQLSKQLQMTSSIAVSTTVVSLPSLKSNLDLFKSYQLNHKDTFILLKIRAVGNVERLTKTDLTHPHHLKQLLQSDSKTFYYSHGDQYVDEIEYGKELIAVIRFEDINKQQALAIQQQLEIKLARIKGLELNAQEAVTAKNEFKVHTLRCHIQLHCCGVNIEAPNIGNNLNHLLDFIAKFNTSQVNAFVPIAYHSIPYVTVLNIPEAIGLEEHIKEMRLLITETNEQANRLRLLINKSERILTASHPATSLTAEHRSHLMTELKHMQDLQQLITDRQREIEKNLLTCNEDQQAAWHKDNRQWASKVKLFEHLLSEYDDPEEIVAAIPSDSSARMGYKIRGRSSDSFHLSAGQSRYLFWQVDPQSHPNADKITFDIKHKKEGDSSYHTLHEHVSGKGIALPADRIQETDKLIIAHPHKANGKSFNVIVRRTNAYTESEANSAAPLSPNPASGVINSPAPRRSKL